MGEAQSASTQRFVTIAGGGTAIGAVAGVGVAILLCLNQGWPVLIASAFDIALGGALIGGLIGANIAGTD